MRTLVLCDADSLPLREPHTSGDLPSGDEVVVVLALRADRATCGWAALEDAARALWEEIAQLARRQAPERVVMEVALTLPMPEAADHVLLRMLHQAPTEEHRGPFAEVWLYSEDRWLQRAFQRAFGKGWVLDGPGRGLRRVRPTGKGSPWKRGSSEPSVAPTASIRDPESPVLVADDDTRAAQIADHDIQAPVDFAHLPASLDADPVLHTQIGVTVGSTRGARRLEALGRAGAAGVAVRPCEAGDGVEYRRAGARSMTVPAGARALQGSTGPGAVRLEWGDPVASDTLRTDLPPGCLQRAMQRVGGCPVAGHSVPDQVLLRFLEGRGDRCEVRFQRQGTKAGKAAPVRCEVVCTEGSLGPPAWWVSWAGGSREITAKKSCGKRPLVLASPAPTTFAACCVRSGDALVLGCPLEPGVTVTPQAKARSGSIVAAKDPEGLTVALLVLEGGVSTARPVTVAPIQTVDPATWRASVRKWAKTLRALPLVVPVPAPDPDPGVRSAPPDRQSHRSDTP
ncbi:MAG: hypothetical protein ABIO70_17010 [Pseudomonadota bacterium]